LVAAAQIWIERGETMSLRPNIGPEGDEPEVHVDPPTSTGKTETIKPNSNSPAVPAYEPDAPPDGELLEGSSDEETGGYHGPTE
jgi:hypothetical protein